ncbi:MAG TPA: ABC transporter substrate-binding protein [Candidatus Acidoferrum sp.]|nr:ABC transporter substrate-binding protein [Candidatus Acidoferrum sp.]
MKRFRVVMISAAVVLAACGGTSGGPAASSSGGPSKVASIAAEVPADIKSLAPLQIATDATYAPNEFIDPDTGAIKGWDVDFGQALCKVMGMACTFNNVTFDDIIAQLKASTPSEQAGGDKPRYQFSLSSWTPTSDREKGGIDFISYYKAGEAWIVKAQGGPTVNSAADMCGKNVAVETGTTEESDAWGFMGMKPDKTPIPGDTDNCKKAGKDDIKVQSFATQTEANSALLSGRADIGWLDQPVADYQVKQTGGKLKIGGKPCSVSPYGIAIVKNSPLEKALTDAVKYLIDNNYYKSILQTWNVTDGAVGSSDVTLNNNNSIGDTCVPSY